MAEAEQKHRHELEKVANAAETEVQKSFQYAEENRIQGIFASDRRGQFLGVLVSMLALIFAAFTAYIGSHWSISVAFLSLPVLGMVKALRQPSSTKVPSDEQTSDTKK